jgi:hypothetical protein
MLTEASGASTVLRATSAVGSRNNAHAMSAARSVCFNRCILVFSTVDEMTRIFGEFL